MAQLWKNYRVAVLTYRKNVGDKWDKSMFHDTDTQCYDTDAMMHICEMGTWLNGHWFREVRKLLQSGHRTAIITTHSILEVETTVAKMFVRWAQENFFKYVMENFDLDRMVQYGTEPVKIKTIHSQSQVQHAYSQFEISKREKGRLEARLFKKINKNGQPSIQEMNAILIKNDDLVQRIEEHNQEIESL